MGRLAAKDEVRPIELQSEASAQTSTPDRQSRDVLALASGGGVAFVGTVVTRGLGYIYSAVLVWGLGAENFGLYTLALAIIGFVGVLAELGLDLGIVRFGATYAKPQRQASIHRLTMAALRVSLSIGLLFVVAVLVSADPVAEIIFRKPQLAPLLKVLGLSIPFMSVEALLLAATRANKIIKNSVYVWVIQPLAALVFAVLLMALGLGMPAVAASLVMSYVLGAGLAIHFYRRAMPDKGGDAEPVSARQIVKFSIPLSLTKWIQYANERTEVLFLGLLPNTVDVGIYKIAWSLAGLQTILRLSLEQIFAPFSSDLSHRREIKQLEGLYKTTSKWGFTAAMLLFVIYCLFGETIMAVFDPAFVAGVSALIVLGLAQLFNEATGTCGTVLIMSGRSDLALLNTIVLLISSIALDLLLIPRYGLNGAAVAGALTIILVNSLRVVEVWLTLKIHPLRWSFAKPIIAGLSSAAVVYVLREFMYSGTPWIDLVYAVLLIAVYIAVIWCLKLDSEDKMVLNAIGRRMSGLRASMRARPADLSEPSGPPAFGGKLAQRPPECASESEQSCDNQSRGD